MYEFTFQYPYAFALILLLIILKTYFKRSDDAYYIPHFIEQLPHHVTKRFLKTLLVWVMSLAMITALASPIVIKGKKLKPDRSIDIVLALDSSGSMSLTGLNPLDPEQTRWDVVKEVVKDFIMTRDKDRIGLVLFGTTTAVASPLTQSKQALLTIVDAMELGVVGKSTALMDGLTTAVNLLQKSTKRSKVVILLSDGEDTKSKVPLDVSLKFTKKYDVKVYTVAIGEGRNNILKLIAKKNSGKSFYAASKEDLHEVYRVIEKLERTAVADKQIKQIDYYAFHTLAVALIAAMILLLSSGIRERY